MSQGLHLAQRLSQSLVLSPQMQQSLALLQAPTLELKALVEQELQQNPVLEEVANDDTEQIEKAKSEDPESEEVPAPADPAEPPEDVNFDSTTEKPNGEPADDFMAEFERLAQLDQEWRDHFAATNIPMRQSAEDDEKRQFMFDSIVAATSLQEILLEQMRESRLTEEEKAIGELLIGNIDDHGYLKTTLEELAQTTSIPPEKIEPVLHVVQTFDPPGVGARTLQECLLRQLERAGEQDSIEFRIVKDHMEALGKRRIPEIARSLGLDVDDVQEAIGRIARLEPRPGRAFVTDNNQYIMPEVFVQRAGDDFLVTTNNDQIPHLRISNTYKDLMAQSGNSAEVLNYIREKIRAGKFLIKSLHQRQQTILNIGNEIVKRQRDFMEKGVAFLKPLTMVQVAEAVGVHETTVSRAVSAKYMQTPQGIFEMKYFFTAGIQTASGEGMSNTSVKDMIADMFRKEDCTKPLSDQEIVKMLQEKGIVIARRTVAKYRSELNILPSNLRKVY
ncbi:MAG TPA: RNA polymerase factor sigma-54 [Verrucomicrobiae bacterium]|jgi:RNA polymerase sigma-54 factor|nr:RNA polymerase factor sigma-54 [Verrucomicrobiae bacterium]